MADSLRVYPQQATKTGAIMDAGVCIVMSDDPWPDTIQNLLLSCCDENGDYLEEDASIDMDSVHVIEAESFVEINRTAEIQDGRQYIICPSFTEYEAYLRANNVRASEVNGEDPLARASSHKPMETLEALSYYFDDHGQLRHSSTDQRVSELVKDESRVNEIDGIVKAAMFHIQMDMLAEMDFKQILLPLEKNPDNPREPRCSIFITENWRKCSKLVIVIAGGRGVEPGIWSRDLLIQEGLDKGSMLPIFERTKDLDGGVIVLNPYKNRETVGNESISIRNSTTPEEHILYVWDTIISKSKAKHMFLFGYSFAAKLAKTLLMEREKQVISRVRGIAFVEGQYSLDGHESSNVIRMLQTFAINFKSDKETEYGSRIPTLEKRLGCICFSVGGTDTKNSKSSNKARTISAALPDIMLFYKYLAEYHSTQSSTTGMPASALTFRPSKESDRNGISRSFRGIFSRGKSGPGLRLSSRSGSGSGSNSDLAPPPQHEEFVRQSSSKLLNGQRGELRPTSGRSSKKGTAVCIDDFDLLKVVGKGSIGKVFMVRKFSDHKIYAMKVLKKSNVVRNGLEEHIKTERMILEEIDHPFIARLRFSFQTSTKLYLVTDYCSGGELFHHLSDEGFSLDQARFYCAELVLGLQHLHQLNVAYRDLKPENILIEASGHLRITDFGLSKMNVVNDHGAQTFVGSQEYLAPEVYNLEQYGFTVDWWSLGVLLYEMLVGRHPFFNENQEIVLKNIMIPNFIQTVVPESLPSHASSLICGLLEYDPNRRLGRHGAQEIRDHPFFATINWDSLLRKEMNPPWKPIVKSDSDVDNFDEEFTTLPAIDSVQTQQSCITQTFTNFSFNQAESTPTFSA